MSIRDEYQEVSSLFKKAESGLNEVTAEIKVKKPMVEKIKSELAAQGIVFEKLEDLEKIYADRSQAFVGKLRNAKAQLESITN